VLAACALLFAQTTLATTIDGRVTTGDGSALRGALITLVSADGLLAETVYTGDDGHFRLDTTQIGNLELRVRAPGFGDATRSVALGTEASTEADFALVRLASSQEISDSLTGSAHYTRIKFTNAEQRKHFQTDCLSCHQIGSPWTRQPRTHEQWTAVVTRMLGYSGNGNPQTAAAYTELMANAFDGRPYTLEQNHEVAPEVLGARLTEWKLPHAQIAHDTEIDPADGRFYTVDGITDHIYITDPTTNITEAFELPANDVPLGGKFTTMGMPAPIGMTNSRHGPHSIQHGPDGRFYITSALGGDISVFDPVKRTLEDHPVGGDALWPHTLRFDAHGIVWFTISISNQVGRFDPGTGEMTLIDLPKTTARPDGPFLFPYGIDVHPIDGSIWYSRMWANKIGRIDPHTLAVQEFDPPLSAPRRLRFDASGMLWIPAFGDGALVRLDTRSMEYKAYRIPTLSPEETEAPYAVAVDPRRQEVWVTANVSDRLFRFLPAEERFIAYPLPTRGTYTREFFFPADGRVCSPSSPLPARPDVVEGGLHAIVCIDLGEPRTQSAAR
jgi:streptogramin lyase